MRIFNEKEVDELIFLNISTDKIPWRLLKEIAEECFMPLAYGGGLRTLEDIRMVLKCGIEKVIISSQLYISPEFVLEAVKEFGSSTIVASLDVKKNVSGKYNLYAENGRVNTKKDPVEFARELEKMGIGELMLNAIDREGTMKGYDLKLIETISKAVNIPVIASGGAATIDDLDRAVNEAGASAGAAGSMFVFHGKHRAVLISYPDQKELKRIFDKK